MSNRIKEHHSHPTDTELDRQIDEVLRDLQVEILELVGDEFAPKSEKGSDERQRLLALTVPIYPLLTEAKAQIKQLIAKGAAERARDEEAQV